MGRTLLLDTGTAGASKGPALCHHLRTGGAWRVNTARVLVYLPFPEASMEIWGLLKLPALQFLPRWDVGHQSTYSPCQVSQVQHCTRTPGTQPAHTHTALICCRGRIQTKSSAGKEHAGEVKENQAQAAKDPTPAVWHWTRSALSAGSGDHPFETFPTREAH